VENDQPDQPLKVTFMNAIRGSLTDRVAQYANTQNQINNLYLLRT